MAIAVRSLGELPTRLQQLHDRARQAAVAGDPAYAIQVLTGLLHDEPGCVEARVALYEAHLAAVGGRLKGWRKALAALRLAWPLRGSGPRLLAQGQAEAALALADRMMRVNPSSREVLAFLAGACESAGLPQVALDAWERRVRLYPCDPAAWRGLADHCLRHGLPGRAVEALKRLAELRPDDLLIREDIRRAAAATAAAHPGTRVGTQADARPTETAPAPAESEEELADLPLDERIARAEARAAGEEVPLRAYRDLGRLYAQAKRFDEALEVLRQGAERPGANADSFQDEMVAVCQARYDDALERWREYVQGHPERAAEAQREIEIIGQEREQFLLDQQRLRAERHPLDSHIHFTLGEMLLRRRDWDEAMASFGVARNHPNLKARSCAGIGRCLAGKGHAAEAAVHFREALAVGVGFAPQSRERLGVMYDLALAYEASGHVGEANLVFKDIYTQDKTFSDVRERIDRLAAGQR